jgi:hypothetical protein
MLLAFLAGFAVPLAMLLLHASSEGYLGRFIEVTRRNFEYGALNRIPFSTSAVESAKVLVRMAADQSLAVFLGVVTLAAWIRDALRSGIRKNSEPATGKAGFPANSSTTRLWRRVALLWLVAAYAGTFPGGRHYHHYYHVLWAPLAVLASLGLAHVWRACRLRSSGRLIAACVVTAALLIAVAVNVYAFGKWAATRKNPDDLSRPANVVAAAVDRVQAMSKPDAPIAAYVWLDHAEIYWRLDRPLVSYSVPHVLPDERLNEWAAAVLAQDRVTVIVDQSFFARTAGDGAFARLKQRLSRRPEFRIGPPGSDVAIYDLRGKPSK